MEDYIVKINVKDDILPNVNSLFGKLTKVNSNKKNYSDEGYEYNVVIRETILSHIFSILNILNCGNDNNCSLNKRTTIKAPNKINKNYFFNLFTIIGEINTQQITIFKDNKRRYFANVDYIYIYNLDVLCLKLDKYNLGLTTVLNENVENNNNDNGSTNNISIQPDILNSTFLCEITTPLNKCKVYFDVDCYKIDVKYVNANMDEIVNIYKELINELLLTYFNITDKPIISVYDSTTLDKLSLHVIVDNYYIDDYYAKFDDNDDGDSDDSDSNDDRSNVIKQFFKKLLCRHYNCNGSFPSKACKISDKKKIINDFGIDDSIYGRTQALRLLNCTKPKMNNIKKLYCTDLPAHSNIHSLISFVPKNALELTINENVFNYFGYSSISILHCMEITNVKILPSVIFKKYHDRISKIYANINVCAKYDDLIDLHNDGNVDFDIGLKMTNDIKKCLGV